MKLTKNIRLFVLLGLVFLAIILSVYPLVLKRTVVVVTEVSLDSPCSDIFRADAVIGDVSGIPIRSSKDFYKAIKDLHGTTTFLINGNPRSCDIPANTSLGVTVRDIKSGGGIKFGTDIQGGMEFVIELEDSSEENMRKTIDILGTRLKHHGLRNVRIQERDDLIHVLFNPDDEIKVRKVLKPGILEVRLLDNVVLQDGSTEFLVNDNIHELVLVDDRIRIDGSEYGINDSLKLDGLNFKIENVTANFTTFLVNLFENEDILSYSTSGGIGGVIQQPGGYALAVQVELSKKAGENFAKATKNQESMISAAGENLLRDPISIFIDGDPITIFPVPQSDAGKKLDTMVLWGFETTRNEASRRLVELESILDSGVLPTELNIISVDELTGKNIFNKIIIGLLAVVLVVSIFTFIRYHKVEIIALVVSIIIVELVLLFGVASFQGFAILLFLCGLVLTLFKGEVHGWLRWLSTSLMFLVIFGAVVNGWLVDLYSIIGLGLVFLVSIAQTTIINEWFRKEKDIAFKQYENVFELIWKLSFVLTILMTPVFFVGFLRNLSITVVLGVMINTILTKPVYAELVERIKR